MGLFLGFLFCSSHLCVSPFLLVLYYFDYWSFILDLILVRVIFLLDFFVRMVSAVLRPVPFHGKFRISSSMSARKQTGF